MVSKHLMWAEISTVKLVHILYWIKFNNWYQDPHSVKSMPKPPLRQVQVEQNVFLTHDPQQSPPETNTKLWWSSALEFKKWLNQIIKDPFHTNYVK